MDQLKLNTYHLIDVLDGLKTIKNESVDIIICDPEAEYSLLVKELGGEVITIAAGSENHINAMDIPDERKVHKKPMPRLGWLGIFLGFLLVYILFGTSSPLMNSILIGGFIIIITGIIDDIKPIPAKYKLIGQLFG